MWPRASWNICLPYGIWCGTFQDFNAKVLQSLTIPNVNANIQKKSNSASTDVIECITELETLFFAGDWSEVNVILPYACGDDCATNSDREVVNRDGYDIILMDEKLLAL
ncbi:hypothetical protein ACH5RR_032627 [Cinchona calisaya]|uniref:Uncharacterized protein n=1 Tax=Cinchona calisaya TaxID=153742 RepID=A0ABD2YIM3_9GENT